MTLRIQMHADLRSSLDRVQREIPDAMDATIDEVQDFIVEKVRSSMLTPKSGKFYANPFPHIASAPGEAPAVASGDLYASIHKMGTSVVASANHAVYLEFGTRHMAPRPFFDPAARDAVAAFPLARDRFNIRIERAATI